MYFLGLVGFFACLGTKIDRSGDNTTEIKRRISQTRKAINALILLGGTKMLLNADNYTFIKL